MSPPVTHGAIRLNGSAVAPAAIGGGGVDAAGQFEVARLVDGELALDRRRDRGLARVVGGVEVLELLAVAGVAGGERGERHERRHPDRGSPSSHPLERRR